MIILDIIHTPQTSHVHSTEHDSLQSRNAFQRGDLEGAQLAARSSLLFNKLSIGIGIAIIVFVIVIQIAWIIPIAVIAATASN